jgi:hypothetical protein
MGFSYGQCLTSLGLRAWNRSIYLNYICRTSRPNIGNLAQLRSTQAVLQGIFSRRGENQNFQSIADLQLLSTVEVEFAVFHL